MFKVGRATAERHFGKRSPKESSFYIACRDEPFKEGDLVAAKFGNRWLLGTAKRKRRDILVDVCFENEKDGPYELSAWFPRSDVLPVVGLQTALVR